MTKIDHKKELNEIYKPSSKKVMMVDVHEMNFIMIDGKGDPNKPGEFQEAMEGIYSVSYTLKFMIKKGKDGIDYAVMPPEGLWWADDMSSFLTGNKDEWKWTLMIMQPEFVTRELFEEATAMVKKKKDPPALPRLRFAPFKEGPSAQILYLGPYADEGPTIQMLHDFIKEQGFELSGKHHEIYLSDMRRTAPEKLKTIIRQPMRK